MWVNCRKMLYGIFFKMLHENLLITKRLHKFANNRQQLLVEGFSFYAVAEISTTFIITEKLNIMNINEALNACLSNMKTSGDFNDNATVSSIKDLLSCIIDNPVILINCANEEKLSIALLSILTCQFPSDYPTYKAVNVRNLVFATSYYLYMHQLETGRFYDRNWPAFITLLHCGRNEFAKFIVDTNPFAPERINEIMGRPIDNQRSLNAAKGLELNLMLAAKKKGSSDKSCDKVWMM